MTPSARRRFVSGVRPFSLAATLRLCGLVAACGAAAAPLAAQQSWPVPRLTGVFPLGGKPGTTVEITLSGADLDGVRELRFSHPGLTAQPVVAQGKPYDEAPKPQPNRFRVAIAGDVPAGVYDFRAIGLYGPTPPRAFLVDSAEPIQEKEPNNDVGTAQEIPSVCAVDGQVEARNFDCYKLVLKAGERRIVDCWSYRLDTRLDATLVIVDEQGRELARSRDVNQLDPLLDFAAPADGAYFLKIFDGLYAGGAEYGYRLLIHAGPYLEFALPAAGQAGTTQKVTLYGRNLPGGQADPAMVLDGRPLEKLTVDVAFPSDPARTRRDTAGFVSPEAAFVDAFEYRFRGPNGLSNPLMLGSSTVPTLTETEPNNSPAQANSLTLPCEVSGQFYPRGDDDWYTFSCKAGETYVVEVVSQRLGRPTDPYLIVQRVTTGGDGKEQVQDLQVMDDQPETLGSRGFPAGSDDPTVRFTAPADGTYRILIRDLYAPSRGNPKFTYRLAVRPASPDFRLVAFARDLDNNNQQYSPTAPQLRKGGTAWIDCLALRKDDFQGEIEVTAEGLPAGVTCAPAIIGSGENSALLVFRAKDDAAAWSGPVRLVGKAKHGETVLERPARHGAVVWPQRQNQSVGRSRLASDVWLTVLPGEEAPYLLELDGSKVYETSRGGKLSIPLKIVRRGEFKGNLNIEAVDYSNGVFNGNRNFNVNNPQAEFNWELQVKNTAPLGRTQLTLRGQSNIKFTRNPLLIDQAKADQAAADKYRENHYAANKAATEHKQATDKRVAETKQKLQQAEAQAKAATAAAAKEAGNPNLAQAKDAADKALEEAKGAHQAANDAKTVADKAATDAAAALKQAIELKVQADKAVTDLTNQLKPRDFQTSEASTAITVIVHAFPVEVQVSPVPAKVKSKVEFPVKIVRKFGFAEAIDLKLEAPKGFPVQGGQLNIPKDKDAGVLTLDVGEKAPPGDHAFVLKQNVNFNGQGVQFEQPVTVKIEP